MIRQCPKCKERPTLKYGYCRTCKANINKRWRKDNPKLLASYKKKWREKNPDKYRLLKRLHRRKHRSSMGLEQRFKQTARDLANLAKRLGKITQMPCRRCGNPKSQMHHIDYCDPLTVQWYCRECHLRIHK